MLNSIRNSSCRRTNSAALGHTQASAPLNALTKLALGLIGQLKPLPPVGDAMPLRVLLPPSLSGGMPLMSALSSRQSVREFSPEPLPEQVLSDLLWAAGGINRHDLDGRTAPSAMNAQEVLLSVTMPQGVAFTNQSRTRCAWSWPATYGG